MRTENRWEDTDKAALVNALLALKTCPRCRRDLHLVAFLDHVYGCADCRETWHYPEDEKEIEA